MSRTMSPGLSLQTGLAEYRRVAAVAGNSGIQSLRSTRQRRHTQGCKHVTCEAAVTVVRFLLFHLLKCFRICFYCLIQKKQERC